MRRNEIESGKKYFECYDFKNKQRMGKVTIPKCKSNYWDERLQWMFNGETTFVMIADSIDDNIIHLFYFIRHDSPFQISFKISDFSQSISFDKFALHLTFILFL